MSTIFGTVRTKLFTNSFYNFVPNHFGSTNFVRFFSAHANSTSASLAEKKITRKLPEREQNKKLESGYYVPSQNDQGYAKWEEDVIKGIEELDAYNKVMQKLKESSR